MSSWIVYSVKRIVLMSVCMFISASLALGQEVTLDSIGYQTPYRLVKPAVTNAFGPGSTYEARKLAVLKAAETAYGSRAKMALGGSEDLLARVDGGEALAKRFGVGNRSVRKGALRAARVAVAIDSDPRFKLLALDQSVYDRQRRLLTDRDIVFRHRSTGTLARVEVKEVTLSSQTTNQLKYQRQIRLMGEEFRRTGQPQMFVNRREVSPLLKAYAAKQGVLVFDNVVTSPRAMAAPGTTPIGQVLDEMDGAAVRSQRIRQVGVGAGAAFVALKGIQSAKEWKNFREGKGTWTQAAYTTTQTFAGVSYVSASGSSGLLMKVGPSGRAAAILGRVNRFAGPAGKVLAIGATGIRGYQWYSGEISTRQLVTEASTTAGGIAGGIAGAWAGAAVGTLGGPAAWLTVPAGAIIGGIGGAFAGETAVGYGMASVFSRLDDAEKQELFKELCLYYQNQAKVAP